MEGAPLPSRAGRSRATRSARTLSKVLFALLILAVSLEGLAQMVVRVGMGISRHDAHHERLRFLSALPVELRTDDPTARAKSREDRPWFERLELHPFFGYVLDRSWGDLANNHGFMASADYPYQAQPWEYVIGIFGGSVAQQVAHHGHTLAEALRPALLERGYRKVTVLDFAQGASKQPSAFFTLTYYLPELDLAINLDGLNDAFQAEGQLPDYPAAFPTPLVYRPLLALASSPYAARDAARLSLLEERAAWVTRFVDESFLRHALFPHLAWRAWSRSHEERVRELRQGIESAGGDLFEGIEPPSEDGGRDALDRYYDLYRDVTHHSDLITRAAHKLFFHFIQPNQYVAGAKPLSDEERASYVTSHPPDFHGERYARLEAVSAELRRRGVESHSLKRVFADEPRTMYRDDCCHLNNAGIERVNLAIAHRILDSGELERVIPMDPADPGMPLRSRLDGLADLAPRSRSRPTSHVRRDGLVVGRVARAFLAAPEGGATVLALEAALPPALDHQRVEVFLDDRRLGDFDLDAAAAARREVRFELADRPAAGPVHEVELRAERTAVHPEWSIERFGLRLFRVELEGPASPGS